MFLGVLTGIEAPRKVASNKGPMLTKGHYIKRPLQIKGIYTDKGPSRTRSSYRQGPLQVKDPYRRCVILTDKGPLQII